MTLDSRGSRQERGYGAAWERLRKTILERDSFLCQCRRCKAQGRTSLAEEVDHIIPKAKALALGWTQQQIDAPSNLQAISRACHLLKSKEERGAQPIERIRFSKTGMPIW